MKATNYTARSMTAKGPPSEAAGKDKTPASATIETKSNVTSEVLSESPEEDYLREVKSSTREADESIDKLRASLQKIHAIDIVGFSNAHLMIDLMGEGKSLAALMIQRVFRGHLGRMERDYIVDEVPHLVHVKEVKLVDLEKEVGWFGDVDPTAICLLNSFTRSHCKNWRVYSVAQTLSVGEKDPIFSEDMKLITMGPGKIVVNVMSQHIFTVRDKKFSFQQ